MTTLYKYYIRYYKTTKKGLKRYSVVESPDYAFDDVCYECMLHTMRNIVSSGEYKVSSYWIDSVMVDGVDGRKVLMKPDTDDLPF